MVRKRSFLRKQTPKSKLSKSPSTSQMSTPTRQSPKGGLSQKPKSTIRKSTIGKKKRKRGTSIMLVGPKTFSISTKILREIKQYQMSTNNLIPKLPFSRLVQELISAYVPSGRRIQCTAVEALQEATESYLVQYFEDSYACSLHARRSTLIPRDMELIQYLRRST